MKIAFTGPYCTANFGDWAILINNIYDINPDSIVVFTYSRNFPHSTLSYYLDKDTYKTQEVVLKNNTLNSNQVITPSEILSGVENIDSIEEEISSIDVLCVSGGGWLNDSWCSRTDKFIKVVTPIIIAQKRKIPIIFMSQGIGPIVSYKENLRLFFNYIRNASISLRDDYLSPSYLGEILSPHRNNKIEFLPDDLLFLNNKLTNPKLDLDKKEKFIVLVIHESMDYIITHVEDFVEFESKLYEKYGLSIVLLPFDLVHFGAEQSKYLHQHMKHSKLIDINERKFIPIETVYSYIKNAELVITSRYHAGIFALSSKTPFICKLYEFGNGTYYSYNKLLGALENTFSGTIYEETLFFSSYSWKKIFDEVLESLDSISKKQKQLYNSEIYQKNMLRLLANRVKYIKTNFIKKIIET